MDEMILIMLVTIAINGLFDAVVVASLAGKRSKNALISWLQGPEATTYYGKIAEQAELRITPRMEAMQATIRSEIDSKMGEFTQKFVMPDLDSFKVELSEELKASAKGVMMNMNSQATRALQKELKGMAPAIEAVEEQALTQLQGSIDPRAAIFQQLMSVDVSDEFAEKYPLQASIVKMGKLGMLQYAQTLNSAQGGAAKQASGFSPGLPG